MRIDYSEPKQSYISGQQRRDRKEPAGHVVTIVIVTALTTFIAGFGLGWVLSQRSAKKAFQAALAQTSLETAPQKSQPTPPPAPAPQQPAASQPGQPGQPAQGAPGATPEPPLSFYKTLPGGQKGNALGSGINAKEEKKQPLQAAIPSNLSRQQEQPQPAEKQGAEGGAAKGAAPSGFTVQVGSYSLKSEAEALKNKLAGKGYSVTISESNQGDRGIWYRVRVGKRLEQEGAKELAVKLGKGAMIIPDRD